MKSWVITGGIGCGKSSVSEFLAESLLRNKEAYFSADRAVQHLLDTPAVLAQLKLKFGEAAVSQEEGQIKANRDWLRAEVFSNLEKRRLLEEILHPAVLTTLETERSTQLQRGANLFLAEVPLHYEIGGTVSADLIIVVAASPEVQKRRLMERRGLDESIIEQMLRAQWPIEAKVERADVVIWNEGDLSALEAQVLTLVRQHWQA